MKISIISKQGTWRDIANRCNTTIGRAAGTKEPSDSWKIKILRSEHSPIRTMTYTIRMESIPYFVSVHLVRHNVGITHFVTTQRTDRTGKDRNEAPQSALVDHEIHVNLQALISISRKRLCAQADPETRKVWQAVVNVIMKDDPIVGNALVPECVYRGFCFEFKGCQYIDSSAFNEKILEYRL